MIEVTNKSELIPENDLQELWALSGRVDALCGWLSAELERDPGYVIRANAVLSALRK